MKTIILEIRIDDITNKMGTVMKHQGWGQDESIDQILITIASLDNVKQSMLDKLNNRTARIK
jgi:hypothetical protein